MPQSDALARPFLCPLCGSNEYVFVVFPLYKQINCAGFVAALHCKAHFQKPFVILGKMSKECIVAKLKVEDWAYRPSDTMF